MNKRPETSLLDQQLKKEQPQTNILTQSTTIKGGLIGAAITAFLSWNSGRYNRIGAFLRRWNFVRYFVSKKTSKTSYFITNYHFPPLNTVANNFYCYSGEPGIGKSFHFLEMMVKQSSIRPSLYVSFKSIGREVNFENDLAEQLNYGEDGSGIIGQIIRSIKKIQQINENPMQFQLKYLSGHICFIGAYYLLYHSQLKQLIKLMLYSTTAIGQIHYLNLMTPMFLQSIKRTLPVIVFDDLNKIEHMNMLPQIVRFLKLIEDQATNIMLVSSDEETWSRLRREPGMKDRLRVRQIKYDHIQTANRINEALDKDFSTFKKEVSAHQIYDRHIIKALARDLIGVRQMSLRRFISVLKLVDQEQYETFIDILKNTKQLPISQVTNAFREALFDTQAETMVCNLKTIKRELPNLSQAEYVNALQLLLKKQKLTSDNRIGSNLKIYNIVRDLRSQYVINGRYTYSIFQMAVKKYKIDIEQYQQIGETAQI